LDETTFIGVHMKSLLLAPSPSLEDLHEQADVVPEGVLPAGLPPQPAEVDEQGALGLLPDRRPVVPGGDASTGYTRQTYTSPAMKKETMLSLESS
jgi:hypothetical protein